MGILQGKFDAVNGDAIEKVEINDTGGVDILALDVQVGGVSRFHVRTKDASIGNKPIIKNQALVTFNNPDSGLAAIVGDNKDIQFGTVGAQTLTKALVGKLANMPTLTTIASGSMVVPGFGSNNSAALPALGAGERWSLYTAWETNPGGAGDKITNANDGSLLVSYLEGDGAGALRVHAENGGGSDNTLRWAIIAVTI